MSTPSEREPDKWFGSAPDASETWASELASGPANMVIAPRPDETRNSVVDDATPEANQSLLLEGWVPEGPKPGTEPPRLPATLGVWAHPLAFEEPTNAIDALPRAGLRSGAQLDERLGSEPLRQNGSGPTEWTTPDEAPSAQTLPPFPWDELASARPDQGFAVDDDESDEPRLRRWWEIESGPTAPHPTQPLTEIDHETDDAVAAAEPVERVDIRILDQRTERRFARREQLGMRLGLGLVIAFSVVTLLFLRLDLVFTGGTPTGGDNAGHVWTPSFLRRELWPFGGVTGWSDDWFAGFPVLRFYFPVPMWAITLLGFVVDPSIAYKLVTIVGPATIPIAAWFLGRRASTGHGYRHCAVIAGLAMFPMLWDRHHQIFGGNLLSVFAGEFSFSIGLALALCFLGLLIDVARFGRRRALCAVVLALTALCHLVPTFLAVFGGVIFGIVYLDHRARVSRLLDLTIVGLMGGALSAFWTIPFVARIGVTNSMDYQRNDKILSTLWPILAKNRPEGSEVFSIAVVLAAVGLGWSFKKKERFALALAPLGIAAAIAFAVIPQGHLWNNRLLPIWYLTVYILAGFGLLGLWDAVRGVARIGRWRRETLVGAPRRSAGLGQIAMFALFSFGGFGLQTGLVLPFVPVPSLHGWTPGVQWASSTDSYGRPKAEGWAGYNFSGFEAKKGWKEFEPLITVLRDLPCGRLAWEQDKEVKQGAKVTKADLYDSYGSSFAFMSIPYWTKGCIDTLTGIYFESSPTAPAQFLVGSYISKNPSRSQRNLPYKTLDLDQGVPAMRNLGVRYYVAFSDEAKAAATKRADLREVASADRFDVYEISDNSIVSSLDIEPVVITNVGVSQTSGWNDAGIARIDRPAVFPVPFAADGPPQWQRATLDWKRTAKQTVYGSAVKPLTGIEKRTLTPTVITQINAVDGRISFHVEDIGRPVLVRMSWYPTWKAEGALGPYRVDPNFMVVIPQRQDVVLSQSAGLPERAGQLITLLGVVGLVALFGAERLARKH